MKSSEIRETFLGFFENQHHQRVKSSSLIPAEDPSLLFTNAGMVQFKDCFLGLRNPGYARATSSQKCVRAGGKHNDLENVGFTARHHTFFEMLGNFSFGDYFKKEAIAYHWELITRYYSIPRDKLWITVFETDNEAPELWQAVGVAKQRIIKLGEQDNFWAMGDTGPCGPCTEIHFDWGKKYGCDRPDCQPGCPCGTRFLEIANLVFMQFNRDSTGKMTPLPKPSVDTGTGLERLSAVLQGVYSNYDTDLFLPIIQALESIAKKQYGKNADDDVAMRVVSDHLRAVTFLLSDGVTPSNEGRGYVLRRILRRAIRYGKKLGQEKPFLSSLVPSVTAMLGSVFPELLKNQKVIEVMIQEEESRFHETLHRGMGLLEESIERLSRNKNTVLPGETIFKLYDTFGFPLDLTAVICKEKGLTLDEKGFNGLMDKQKASSVWTKKTDAHVMERLLNATQALKKSTQFLGYDSLSAKSGCIALFDSTGSSNSALLSSTEGFAIFEATPFYAESGGQVGDQGNIQGKESKCVVHSAFKIGAHIIHKVSVETGKLETGGTVSLLVDPRLRQATAINHTATHLLHASLRKHLGDRVKQAGSLVEPERLRFDFTFPRTLSADEMSLIEETVNAEIALDLPVDVKEMAFDSAIREGALAFFDEKYGDRVRVVRVGDNTPVSIELCGGTHLKRTSEIGSLMIVSEASVASGVRRIEALTGSTARRFLLERHRLLSQLEQKFSAKSEGLVKKLDQLLADNKVIARENEALRVAAARGGSSESTSGRSLWETFTQIKDLKVVTERVASANSKTLRALVDQIRDKLRERAVVLLASESEGKILLCLGITRDLLGRLDAGKLVKSLTDQVGGTGGGKPDFAQAGGIDPKNASKAFETFKKILQDAE